MQTHRADRVGEELRIELSELLAREVHDPGIGFVTLTRVHVSPDLQHARVYYTTLGQPSGRRQTQRALERAAPFLRRQIGTRVRLRRIPELHFTFDESIEAEDRVEQLLREIREHDSPGSADSPDDGEN